MRYGTKQWTNGVKNMAINNNVLAKNKLFLDYANRLPDVEAVNVSELTNELKITNHEPLKTVLCSYNKKSRLWSTEYDLWYEVSVPCTIKSGKLSYGLHGFVSRHPNDVLTALAEKLNANTLLKKLVGRNDLLGLDIIFINGNAKIRLCFLTFGITKMIIPPLTHMIKPVHKELIDALQIMQIIMTVANKF